MSVDPGTADARGSVGAVPSEHFRLVDPRGPRFGAGVTALVLALVLITGSGWLLAAQAVVFAIGAAAGLAYTPQGQLYRRFVQPGLGPPTELEPEAPPRFAQLVGFVVAVLGAAGFALGAPVLGFAAAAAAFVAAFLNAAFGWCLACEVYLLFRRSVPRRLPAAVRQPAREDAS